MKKMESTSSPIYLAGYSRFVVATTLAVAVAMAVAVAVAATTAANLLRTISLAGDRYSRDRPGGKEPRFDLTDLRCLRTLQVTNAPYR